MTTPIDPRAISAAEKHVAKLPTFMQDSPVLISTARSNFLVGWDARDAAGPATREQGSGWWMELDIDELREEFACLEEIECQNQAAVAEFGAHCAEKSTDGIYALGNMIHDLREQAKELLEEIDGSHELGGPSFEASEPLRALLQKVGCK